MERHGPVTHAANDRLKAGSSWRAHRALGGSAAIHLLLIVTTPSWTGVAPQRDRARDFLHLESVGVIDVALGPSDSPLEGVVYPIAPIAESDGPEAPISAGQGDDDGGGGVGLWELRDRLAAGAFAPTLAQPQQEDRDEPAETTASAGSEGSGVGDVLSGAVLPDWLAANSLELDRLTAVRPEIVIASPSAWILIRNPVELDLYMARVHTSGILDPSFQGWVQVTIWIDERGSVEWAEVSTSSGRSEVDEVALSLFSEVVSFRPARERGVPVPTSVIFQLSFPWH